jgi:hypothetical protein
MAFRRGGAYRRSHLIGGLADDPAASPPTEARWRPNRPQLTLRRSTVISDHRRGEPRLGRFRRSLTVPSAAATCPSDEPEWPEAGLDVGQPRVVEGEAVLPAELVDLVLLEVGAQEVGEFREEPFEAGR